MKIFLLVLFLSLLSGCKQEQTQTDYQRGYIDGQKFMIDQFWKKLNAEAEMWEEWQIEAENSINEAQKLKKWGFFSAFAGSSLFFITLFSAYLITKNAESQKKDTKEELEKLKIEKDEAMRVIELSNNSRKEVENAKKELSELKSQIAHLKKEIETLILAKAKAEQDYQTAQKKLDEISI